MATHQLKSTSRLLIIVSIVLILGVGLGAFYYGTSRSDSVIPRKGPVVEAVYGLGTIVAPRAYQVKTAVSQSIREIYVQEGDSVLAGAPLVKFDDSGVFKAPFAGMVTSVPFKKGEILFPGTPALTLVHLKELFIEVSLEQQSALRVKAGQKAFVSFETLRGERLEAKVESIFPRDSQFIVRIFHASFPEGILPGMTADVAIEIARKENVLSIPVRSISSGKVTLRRGGKKLKESIQVGVVDGEWAEVISGNILPDDEILVRSK
jgi:macrolide-specific efflux system membrane fusion protein